MVPSTTFKIIGNEPFIKYSPVVLAALDKQLCLLSYSDLWLQNHNLDMGDHAGKFLFDVLPDLPAAFKDILSEALDGKSSMHNGKKFTRPNGSSVWY